MAGALEDAGLLMMGLIAHSVKHANFSLGVSILS
jgi:8-hydroxy-5-deazaflavin:NADPH oxidoreductase